MKIPSQARRVFKGVIFDVYQWEQKMFDGTTETFEKLKRKNDGVTIIATRGDKIIYAEEEQASVAPFITLIGGKREEGEEPLETAKRELLEETGLATNDWELYSVDESLSTKMDWTVHTFIARNVTKMAEQRLDPGEIITVKEATFAKFLDIAARPDFRNKDIAMELFRLRLYYPEKLENFRKKLLG